MYMWLKCTHYPWEYNVTMTFKVRSQGANELKSDMLTHKLFVIEGQM